MVYRLLEFIKHNTDRAHPASQAALRKIAGEELSNKLMGDKGTFSRRLSELADAYNRVTKARYNEIVNAKLERLDELKDLKLEHMMDLEI